jgi:hypothetical protein
VHDTPELAAAVRKSLEIRGDNATGWGIGWRLNLWARLQMPSTPINLKLLLGPDRTYPNMFDAHPPFQIDGNFGGASGIGEMLLQSRARFEGASMTGEIQLLPALPGPSLPARSRACAPRRVRSDLQWADGKLVAANIRSRWATVPAALWGRDSRRGHCGGADVPLGRPLNEQRWEVDDDERREGASCTVCGLAMGVSLCGAAEPQLLQLSGDTGAHDPVIIKEGDTYYGLRPAVGGTKLVPIRVSKDLRDWRMIGHVFADLPEWAPKEIPGTQGVWAPDISFFNGKYHLYYSVSTFGKNSRPSDWQSMRHSTRTARSTSGSIGAMVIPLHGRPGRLERHRRQHRGGGQRPGR